MSCHRRSGKDRGSDCGVVKWERPLINRLQVIKVMSISRSARLDKDFWLVSGRQQSVCAARSVSELASHRRKVIVVVPLNFEPHLAACVYSC